MFTGGTSFNMYQHFLNQLSNFAYCFLPSFSPNARLCKLGHSIAMVKNVSKLANGLAYNNK
jgi:hypothetical protein